MMKFVYVQKRLFSRTHKDKWDIGEVPVNLDLITKPLADFLIQNYLQDPRCLAGDIDHLLAMTDKDFEANNRRELGI